MTTASVVAAALARATAFASRVVQSHMTSVVSITRMSAGHFDQASGKHLADTTTTVYSGPAHIGALESQSEYGIGDELQYFVTGTVHVPLTSGAFRVDDLLKVISHVDPSIVGRSYTVTNIAAAGAVPACRTLTIRGSQPSPSATP